VERIGKTYEGDNDRVNETQRGERRIEKAKERLGHRIRPGVGEGEGRNERGDAGRNRY
jgi:hypothetical protein